MSWSLVPAWEQELILGTFWGLAGGGCCPGSRGHTRWCAGGHTERILGLPHLSHSSPGGSLALSLRRQVLARQPPSSCQPKLPASHSWASGNPTGSRQPLPATARDTRDTKASCFRARVGAMAMGLQATGMILGVALA